MRFLVLTVLLLGAGCGDESGGAGRPCVSPGDCESNVCLKNIGCNNGKTVPSACSGPSCTTSDTCPTGMECGRSTAYCLPPTLCQ